MLLWALGTVIGTAAFSGAPGGGGARRRTAPLGAAAFLPPTAEEISVDMTVVSERGGFIKEDYSHLRDSHSRLFRDGGAILSGQKSVLCVQHFCTRVSSFRLDLSTSAPYRL